MEERLIKRNGIFWPSKNLKSKAWISKDIYKKANKKPIAFWSKLASEGITWFKRWKKVYVEKPPYFKWFVNGKLNVSFNCLDRHLKDRKNKVALIWVPEPIEERPRIFTYYSLYKEVNKFANALKKLGVKKGDIVGIYLPMIPEAQIAMLACSRIGAIHAVVFSAFSSEALRIRLQDTEAKVLITADGYYRRGKLIRLKDKADEGIRNTKVKKVIVVRRAGNEIKLVRGRDFWYHELIKREKNFCKPVSMDSEDVLFILYTSGTTGKPKGIIHACGGYAVQAYWTSKWIFDLHDDDIFWSTADIGWITGHTYSCYGPLLNGTTFLIYEGAPDYPTNSRWCEIIEDYGITIFYTAPTAIRMFERYNGNITKKFNFENIRILGSVGEPIDKDSWLWFFTHVGKGKAPILDTWWQTETGGILITSLPGIGPFIPTFAGIPFPGVRAEVVDEEGKICKPNQEGNLIIKPPYPPALLRGVWKNPKRYKKTYWERYNFKYYFTEDRAYKNKIGLIRITGRADDVMKVAGHRLSTAELENAITLHPDIVECAVVPREDKIKGQVPIAFIVLRKGIKISEKYKVLAVKQVEKYIGPIARPAEVYIVEDLPKTRSGKIMRRILRKILAKEKELGDLSTLANPKSVEKIKKLVK